MRVWEWCLLVVGWCGCVWGDWSACCALWACRREGRASEESEGGGVCEGGGMGEWVEGWVEEVGGGEAVGWGSGCGVGSTETGACRISFRVTA